MERSQHAEPNPRAPTARATPTRACLMDRTCGPAHARDGFPYRRRRAAPHPARPRLQPGESDLGAQCLRTGVRRVAPAWGQAGRHDRTGPRVPDRSFRFRRRLAGRRPGTATDGIDRRPNCPRCRCCAGGPECACFGDGDGAGREGEGAGPVAVHRCLLDRRVRRPDPWRRTHRLPVVALGASHQRTGRGSGGGGDRPPRRRNASPADAPRRCRGLDRDVWFDGACLWFHQRGRKRLGGAGHPGVLRRRRRSPARLLPDRKAASDAAARPRPAPRQVTAGRPRRDGADRRCPLRDVIPARTISRAGAGVDTAGGRPGLHAAHGHRLCRQRIRPPG